MEQERRSFSRIDTFIRGRLRRLPRADAPALFHSGASGRPLLDSSHLKNVKLPEPLIEFMHEMNSKLDMVVSLLSQDRLTSEFPLEIDISSVSGAGIAFACDQVFTVDESVEVVLILNHYPLRMASAVGKIIRNGPVSDDTCTSGETTLWGVNFTRIREPDLDEIVQFVFNEERAQIRQNKWES